ncbi:ABC transporter ATP-binding protein [Metasolibacillus sp. FSL H7-0170]|uniref:ABC transporter ATP-binding protein n=1 Tax=Metasolibacillus sp. FSL H7-0170 TaxID=2921431 RepID=UPI0031582DFF
MIRKFLTHRPLLTGITILLLSVSTLDNILVAEIFKQLYKIVETKNTDNLLKIFVQLVFFYLITMVANFLYQYFQSRIIESFNIEVRNNAFSRYIKSTSSNSESSNITSLLTNDYRYFDQNYLRLIFQSIQYSFYVVFSLIYAFTLEFKMAIIFVIFSIISALFPKLFQKRTQILSKAWSNKTAIYTSTLNDYSLGKEAVTNYQSENFVIKKLNSVSEKMEHSYCKMMIWMGFSNGTIGFVATICFLFPEFIGVYWVVNGNLNFGVLLALMQVSNTIVGPFLAFIKSYNTIQSSKHIAENLLVDSNEMPAQHINTWDSIQSIQFNKAKIGYKDIEVLNGVELTINKGDKILIIGESGSGKSSLINAIKSPNILMAGEILVNGVNRDEIDDSQLLSHISFIQQRIHMFNDSIKNNILLGYGVTPNMLENILEQTSLKEFVKEKGIDFSVGENGNRISGGQRQRIEIARALLREKDFLFVDEATSNLDKRSAEALREIYLNLPCAVVEIAHYIDEKFEKRYNKVLKITDKELVEIASSRLV